MNIFFPIYMGLQTPAASSGDKGEGIHAGLDINGVFHQRVDGMDQQALLLALVFSSFGWGVGVDVLEVVREDSNRILVA